MNTEEGMLNEAEVRQELVDFFGLEKMIPTDQDAVLDKMMEALMKTIFLKTFERLGETGVAEYEKIVETALEPAEIASFLESRISGYNVFVKEIVTDFKHSMAEALAETQPLQDDKQ